MRFRSEVAYAAALVAIVAAVWCTVESRRTLQEWSTPLTYGSDALSGMAAAKAVASGEIVPVLPKHPRSLGAPFVASWDDYPSTEEGIIAWTGLLVRLFGVFAGMNLAVLSAHLLAALAFYFVARHLRYDATFAFAGAMVFAFSRYAFSRGLLHLGLTLYWHVPLGVLAVWWCTREEPLLSNRPRLRGALAIAVIFGIQNAYYAWMFAQLLGLAAVYQLLRRGRRDMVLGPIVLLAALGGTFALMNADTFYSRIVNGPPGEVVARNYPGLEFYALKPIELLLPVVHQIGWVHNWARASYFAKTMLIGEAGSPYLGVVGVLALAWLIWVTATAVARGEERRIPPHTWVVLWILVYSVVGGINGVVGLALELFRGTNRYSIFILTVVLLFLVRQLTRTTRNWTGWPRVALAACVAGVALFDQIPPALASTIAPAQKKIAADRELVARIEARLPKDAMIFQLPVAPFPEAGRVGGMEDYEHLRPFLHSHSLRFSYGSVKGRPRERWQKELEALGVARGVKTLETYGFAAVWINRSGYPDEGAAVIDQLRANGRGDVIAENDEFVCVALAPVATPDLPPEFSGAWYALEASGDQDWRWSSGSAELVLHNAAASEQRATLTFQVTSPKRRHLTIVEGHAPPKELSLNGDAAPTDVELPVTLNPGRNIIRFETDLPGELQANGDPRRLAFCLRNFKVLD
jgi:phosphoglycerol transferase